MILVDVFVPSIDETFDCMLDENAEIGYIITELVEMISKRTGGSSVNGNYELFSVDFRKSLNPKGSLRAEGIKDGNSLAII